MQPDAEFRRQVRDALEHLYDTAYLQTHPLLSQVPTQAVDSRLTRAQRLRGLLKETIESLRPQEGAPAGSAEWRGYLALRQRYVQGMSPGEVELELGISLRQLQRELHKGLDAAAALLWEKRADAALAPAEGAAGELEHELQQWEMSRQQCELQTLVEDTLWMLKPLLREVGGELRVSLPANLAPLLVDTTLTRQALFKVLRALLRDGGASVVSLGAREEAAQTHLVLRAQTPTAFDSAEDWQSAQLLCRQQGHRLSEIKLPQGLTEVTLALPRVSLPRVLVIDDNAGIHQLFERYLAPYHYEIIHARGGQEALQLAVERQPQAITLDVMMPNVDGWQVLRGLSGNPATAPIPIIICSVLSEPELAFSLGARAYLKKPVDRLELVAALARLLSSANPGAAEPPAAPERS